MLSSELGRKRSLFVWVMDGPLGLEAVKHTAVEERVEKLRLDQLRYGR